MPDRSTDVLARQFRFDYEPAVLRSGPGCVAALDEELRAHGAESALVVCGSTVGATPVVVDPVTEGLGDRLAGVFPETTPEKRLGTAYDALDRFRATNADAIVGLGGGSSLDVATVTAVLAATDRDPDAVGAELVGTGSIAVPDAAMPPVVAVPTTLAGADLSVAAGVTADPDTCPVSGPASGGVSGAALMPDAVCHDPDLLATTPRGVLAASAMNGFDKGIETLYAATATPVTDATASEGLDLLTDALLAFGEGREDASVFRTLARGIALVQYGTSRADGTTLSLIHAFGHALARTYPVQQGAAHAVIAPHALALLFDRVDGRRGRLADALGVGDADDGAAAVVDRVAEVARSLGLPTRLRDVDGPEREAFPAVSEAVLADSFMTNTPAGFDPSRGDIEAVLDAAW